MLEGKCYIVVLTDRCGHVEDTGAVYRGSREGDGHRLGGICRTLLGVDAGRGIVAELCGKLTSQIFIGCNGQRAGGIRHLLHIDAEHTTQILEGHARVRYLCPHGRVEAVAVLVFREIGLVHLRIGVRCRVVIGQRSCTISSTDAVSIVVRIDGIAVGGDITAHCSLEGGRSSSCPCGQIERSKRGLEISSRDTNLVATAPIEATIAQEGGTSTFRRHRYAQGHFMLIAQQVEVLTTGGGQRNRSQSCQKQIFPHIRKMFKLFIGFLSSQFGCLPLAHGYSHSPLPSVPASMSLLPASSGLVSSSTTSISGCS